MILKYLSSYKQLITMISVMSLLTIFLYSCHQTKNENKDSQSQEFIWRKHPKIDVFGDTTSSFFMGQRIHIKTESGTRGGSFNGVIKRDKIEDVDSYIIIFMPKKDWTPNYEYGDFLKLYYKVNDGNASDAMVLLDYKPNIGYVFPKEFNKTLRNWEESHSNVKFIGFTTDNPFSEEFKKGIIKTEKGDVYLDPAFCVQF